MEKHTNGSAPVSQTPDYSAYFRPIARLGKSGKKLWSADLETFWVGKALASNVMGYSDVPLQDIGAPIRVARNKDTNEPKFSSTGRLVTVASPGMKEYVQRVQENVFATLNQFEGNVRDERPEAFGRMVAAAAVAGRPIQEKDATDAAEAEEARAIMASLAAEAAKLIITEPEKPKRHRHPKQTQTTPDAAPTPEPTLATPVAA